MARFVASGAGFSFCPESILPGQGGPRLPQGTVGTQNPSYDRIGATQVRARKAHNYENQSLRSLEWTFDLADLRELMEVHQGQNLAGPGQRPLCRFSAVGVNRPEVGSVFKGQVGKDSGGRRHGDQELTADSRTLSLQSLRVLWPALFQGVDRASRAPSGGSRGPAA